jgi:hypothetical protein|eukprot:13156-Heterococcus_DN1.PRE.3
MNCCCDAHLRELLTDSLLAVIAVLSTVCCTSCACRLSSLFDELRSVLVPMNVDHMRLDLMVV